MGIPLPPPKPPTAGATLLPSTSISPLHDVINYPLDEWRLVFDSNEDPTHYCRTCLTPRTLWSLVREVTWGDWTRTDRRAHPQASTLIPPHSGEYGDIGEPQAERRRKRVLGGEWNGSAVGRDIWVESGTGAVCEGKWFMETRGEGSGQGIAGCGIGWYLVTSCAGDRSQI